MIYQLSTLELTSISRLQHFLGLSGDMPIGIGNGIRVEFAGITIVFDNASINNEIADVNSFGPQITSQGLCEETLGTFGRRKASGIGLASE
jgi:hypothetical protein